MNSVVEFRGLEFDFRHAQVSSQPSVTAVPVDPRLSVTQIAHRHTCKQNIHIYVYK